MRNNQHHLIRAIIFFLILVVVGIIGYASLLDISFVDAVYMTIITISTVGYKEVAEMTPAAKLFSVLIIFGGIALVGYTLTNLVEFLAGGQLKDSWRNKRMENKIEALKDHYIVCGAGETGQNVASQLELSKVPFVVVDNREEKIIELRERGILALHGEPTQEAALKQAQISRAKGLVSCLTTDSENIYTVLTARYLNNDLYIVSRAIEPHAHEKLTMAGADRTVSPNAIGGRRMAAMMVKPSIFSFLDIVTYAGEDVLNLEEVVLHEGSDLIDKKLGQAEIPKRTGLLVMALKKARSGAFLFNPSTDELLELGDSMIVLGDPERVNLLNELAMDPSAARAHEHV
jgi:voltage-gated potassium channel